MVENNNLGEMSGSAEVERFLNKAHDDEAKALRHLATFVSSKATSKSENEAAIKKKEELIMGVGRELAERKSIDNLRLMIENTRPFLVHLGKAKAAKLVRNLVDLFLTVEDPTHKDELRDIKVKLCHECIQWAREQNRVFLRQTLQARLVRLYNDIEMYNDALTLATALVRELKKLDDKELIVEVQLEESKACYHLQNLAKARAALTSARTTANAMYIPPRMQAALDMQSAILHAADERDFKTAFSYFYEAFEGYDSVGMKPEALRALKYMCLSKVMLDLPDEVNSITTGKLALKYTGADVEAMRLVAGAAKRRSLADFNRAFGKHPTELQCDPVVKTHFGTLSDSMLEKDLCRLIQPYSRVQLAHVATKIGLDQTKVEKKLGQMILDKTISGTLDQGEGVLILYEADARDELYGRTLDSIHAMGTCVDALYSRVTKLT